MEQKHCEQQTKRNLCFCAKLQKFYMLRRISTSCAKMSKKGFKNILKNAIINTYERLYNHTNVIL